jgi:hypothetical protein
MRDVHARNVLHGLTACEFGQLELLQLALGLLATLAERMAEIALLVENSNMSETLAGEKKRGTNC